MPGIVPSACRTWMDKTAMVTALTEVIIQWQRYTGKLAITMQHEMNYVPILEILVSQRRYV